MIGCFLFDTLSSSENIDSFATSHSNMLAWDKGEVWTSTDPADWQPMDILSFHLVAAPISIICHLFMGAK